MDALLLQILNGLDKGSAYALIALGLTLIFGTLGVVNFAHGALFMIGAFCAVTLQRISEHLNSHVTDPTKTDFLGNPATIKTPVVETWFGPEMRRKHYRLVRTIGHPVRDPNHGCRRLHYGTWPDQALLQTSPR